MRALVLGLVSACVLVACPGPPATGPVEVAWDRDVCSRCNMAIGDRRFAAQIRTASDQRAHVFDDLGCALLWLDAEGAALGGAEEIWVRDLGGADWLDARAARFVAAEHTPMNYGFGAVAAPADAALALEQVHAQVREVEGGRRAHHR